MKWRLGVVALVCGIAAMLPMSPASTWTSAHSAASQTEAGAADSLTPARRAASDAASQLGLLTAGTSQLVSGVGQLDEGKVALVDAISQARTGAQELSSGMVQLQAGTGQLGAGATQLADSVGQVVDQVAGFEVVRGQVVAAIDRALESTKDSKDPDVVASRDALGALREQALTAEIPADAVAKMHQLRDGSRDLANQLAVPGYGYHDGVYNATNGAAALASGLGELETQVLQASEGITQLVDGAQRVNTMATQSADKVGAVRAALPVAVETGGAAAGGSASGGSTGGAAVVVPRLSPIAAMLISAMALLCGVGLAVAAWFAPRGRRWVMGAGTLALAAAGTLLAGIVGGGFGFVQYVGVFVACALSVLAASGLSRVLACSFGAPAGFGLAGALAVAQVGLVGWVWRSAAAAPISRAWEAASQALPMHWGSAAISAFGNAGSHEAIVSALLLCAFLAVLGLGGARARA